MIWTNRLWDSALAVMIGVLLIPVAFIGTILTTPVWLWIENTFSVEAIGHSGPAEWCYLVVYACMVALAGIVWFRFRGRRARND